MSRNEDWFQMKSAGPIKTPAPREDAHCSVSVVIIANRAHQVQHVGDVGHTESDAWHICLGWPTDAEVIEKQSEGWYAAQASLTWMKKA